MSLVFERLTKRYGSVEAIKNVSLTFEPGLIHGIIGPNGAGKSTLINMATGSYTVSDGAIVLDGQRINGLPKHRIANRGIARTYQNIRLFDQMTALENLEVCFYPEEARLAWREILWPLHARERRSRRLEICMRVLERFDLVSWANHEAGSLPYGRQRMLEIARAVVRDPRVLLLDEPAAGLNHGETADLAARLDRLRDPGRIMIIVEHDMDLMMSLCDRIIVMHHGTLLFQGKPEEVQASADVQNAYLGNFNDIEGIKAAAEDRRVALGMGARRGSVRS